MVIIPYIKPEVIQEAKRVDLLTYLQSCEPQELIQVSGGTYCTREHDSLRISNGRWCWFSRGIGGRSALDYLIKVRGIPFTDAVAHIVGKTAAIPSVFMPKSVKQEPKKLLLPKANGNASQVITYLVKRRGIDRELVDYCISTGRIYESFPHHNAVFVGRDKHGVAKSATLRGIGSDLKSNAKGSDMRYSFSLTANAYNDAVNVFESAIDLLSFATLQKLNGKNPQHSNLLSIAGVFQSRKHLPPALKQYLLDYEHIKKVILRLDNDEPGRCTAEAIMAALSTEYDLADSPPPVGKDYNDTLLSRSSG